MPYSIYDEIPHRQIGIIVDGLASHLAADIQSGGEAALAVMRWFGDNGASIRATVAVPVLDLANARPPHRDDRDDQEGPPTPPLELRDELLLTPVSAASRSAPRPHSLPWTLADVRAFLGLPKPNPAPKRRDGRPIRPADRGTAWSISAPEGFPPYPRRGTEYTREEAGQIVGYILHTWPALKEITGYAGRKDDELLRAGVDPSRIHTLLRPGWEQGNARSLKETTYNLGIKILGEAGGISTPMDVKTYLEGAAEWLRPVIVLLDNVKPATFGTYPVEEVDEQVRLFEAAGMDMEPLWRSYNLNTRIRDAASEAFWPGDWGDKIPPRSSYGYHLTTTDGKRVPLSVQILAEQNQMTAYRAKQADFSARYSRPRRPPRRGQQPHQHQPRHPWGARLRCCHVVQWCNHCQAERYEPLVFNAGPAGRMDRRDRELGRQSRSDIQAPPLAAQVGAPNAILRRRAGVGAGIPQDLLLAKDKLLPLMPPHEIVQIPLPGIAPVGAIRVGVERVAPA